MRNIKYSSNHQTEFHSFSTFVSFSFSFSYSILFDKIFPNGHNMDIREFSDILCDGRKLEVKPDILGDFRNIPFSDKEATITFYLACLKKDEKRFKRLLRTIEE